MVKKENLSKYKYVYTIYKDNDTINVEKFPIVYSNSEYVYYKFASKNELSKINIREVDEKYNGITTAILDKLKYSRIYLLDINGFDIEEAKLHFYKKSKEKILEDAKLRLDRITREYNIAKREYEELLNLSLTD